MTYNIRVCRPEGDGKVVVLQTSSNLTRSRSDVVETKHRLSRDEPRLDRETAKQEEAKEEGERGEQPSCPPLQRSAHVSFLV